MNERKKDAARPDRGSPPRIVLHAVFAVLGWILFAYFWRLVSIVGLSAGARTALVAMVIFLALLVFLTSWWIAHNLGIARRNRRKRTAEPIEKLYLFDVCGLRVEMPDNARMKSATVIEITIDESHKRYLAMADRHSDESVTS